MRKTWALTRILLKNGTGPFAKSGKSGRKFKQIVLPLLVVVALLPFMFLIGNFISALYKAFEPIGQEGAVLALGLALASMIVFMFGIFYTISVFYYTQDVEHLLPLPLKPVQIVTAKFVTVLVYEYLTQFIILAPLFVVFGMHSGSGFLYYVYAVIIFITLPIAPLVLSSIIAMAVTSFSGIARNKDRFRMIGGAVAILLSFGLNMFIQRTMNRAMKPEQLQEMLLGGNNSLVDVATRSLPNVRLAAQALLKGAEFAGFAWLVLFVALSVLFYLAFALLASRFYFKGVMGISETAARRAKLSGSQLDKITSQQSAVAALVRKELRILVRTPSYFLNCVLMAFLWPVIMLIPMMTQPDLKQTLGSVRTLFESSGSSPFIPAIAVAIVMFVSGANATASTSISREGAGFFVSKYVPVPSRSMITAKVAAGMLINMAGVVLILLVALVVLHIPPAFALAMVPISFAAVLFTCMTGVTIDLLTPKLVWENEQKAVKQNMNSLFNMLVSVAGAALLFGLVVSLGLGLWSATALLFVVLAAADVLLFLLLKSKGSVWFDKIEAS
ncbi:putative ABC transporter permease subunit [Paenibacillus ginsengarvi]|uniref:Uncharacterized protein n=1 Tax=Paenibacillus ginsengarvi TaxID=400777 RepID=A0A3B0C3L5_9BACL|nr:ABC transporter permease [Paenibacillus ginsengarvi]RKN79151.1 hypothetical protein D7M11_20940 [Paenibacillus ginsengarvi]